MKQVKVADDKTEFPERRIDLNIDPNLISEHELHFKNTELGKINQVRQARPSLPDSLSDRGIKIIGRDYLRMHLAPEMNG